MIEKENEAMKKEESQEEENKTSTSPENLSEEDEIVVEETEDEIENSDEVVDEDALEETEEDSVNRIALELVKAEAAAKENQERYQRTMAEFDNFRKRTQKEKATMFRNGAKEVLETLLPVVDNFERALDSITEEEKELGITKGVEMIYKQMLGALEEIGVKEIEAVGQPFDPDLHNAVSHEDNDDEDENVVVEVFQKGYMYKDAVLRHSMVKVAN